jgi:hypothetical protein
MATNYAQLNAGLRGFQQIGAGVLDRQQRNRQLDIQEDAEVRRQEQLDEEKRKTRLSEFTNTMYSADSEINSGKYRDFDHLASERPEFLTQIAKGAGSASIFRDRGGEFSRASYEDGKVQLYYKDGDGAEQRYTGDDGQDIGVPAEAFYKSAAAKAAGSGYIDLYSTINTMTPDDAALLQQEGSALSTNIQSTTGLSLSQNFAMLNQGDILAEMQGFNMRGLEDTVAEGNAVATEIDTAAGGLREPEVPETPPAVSGGRTPSGYSAGSAPVVTGGDTEVFSSGGQSNGAAGGTNPNDTNPRPIFEAGGAGIRNFVDDNIEASKGALSLVGKWLKSGVVTPSQQLLDGFVNPDGTVKEEATTPSSLANDPNVGKAETAEDATAGADLVVGQMRDRGGDTPTQVGAYTSQWGKDFSNRVAGGGRPQFSDNSKEANARRATSYAIMTRLTNGRVDTVGVGRLMSGDDLTGGTAKQYEENMATMRNQATINARTRAAATKAENDRFDRNLDFNTDVFADWSDGAMTGTGKDAYNKWGYNNSADIRAGAVQAFYENLSVFNAMGFDSEMMANDPVRFNAILQSITEGMEMNNQEFGGWFGMFKGNRGSTRGRIGPSFFPPIAAGSMWAKSREGADAQAVQAHIQQELASGRTIEQIYTDMGDGLLGEVPGYDKVLDPDR